MSYQDSIIKVLQEYGRRILTESQFVNILSDNNAYDEDRSFKTITRLICELTYIDKIRNVKNWEVYGCDIKSSFVKETGVQENLANYLLDSIAYALGIASDKAMFVQSNRLQEPKNITSASKFNLSYTQLAKKSDNFVQTYKEDAERYLDSIIEYKGDFSQLGAKINVSCEYSIYSNDSSIHLNFEIDGAITIPYNYHVAFNYVLYNHDGRVLGKSLGLRNKSNMTYEIVSTDSIDELSYKNIANIAKICVYWDSL